MNFAKCLRIPVFTDCLWWLLLKQIQPYVLCKDFDKIFENLSFEVLWVGCTQVHLSSIPGNIGNHIFSYFSHLTCSSFICMRDSRTQRDNRGNVQEMH